ncbi:MAG TPA: VOC family protein [Candidatus Limnocylindrales bacterium]|nr:VOC family protein [Candidatus Limnocylindrales bacterium]
MDFKLEVVIVPVADVDRAKAFYMDQLGFNLDVDFARGEFRVVQLTPPGSACSITLLNSSPMAPGSLKGVHLCVEDIVAARAELVGRGLEVSEPYHFGAGGETPGVDPKRGKYESYLSFSDPDGNEWVVQEIGPS